MHDWSVILNEGLPTSGWMVYNMFCESVFCVCVPFDMLVCQFNIHLCISP